jgi:hypothetical protein
MLSQLAPVSADDIVKFKELPRFKAVLVYACTSSSKEPRIALLLDALSSFDKGWHVALGRDGGESDVVVSNGSRLFFADTFETADETAAAYYLFKAVSAAGCDTAEAVLHFTGKMTPSLKSLVAGRFKTVSKL